MITNPNSSVIAHRDLPVREPDDEEPITKIGEIKVRSLARHVNYDEVIDNTFAYMDTKIINIDAKLMEGVGRRRKPVHYRSFRELTESKEFKRRIRESVKLDTLKDVGERLKEHGGDFTYGLYPDERGVSGKTFSITDNVLPSTNSPASKQMLFVDYLDMHRKSFEAATRNPIGKRIVRLIPQFVLGRNILITANDADYQRVWDENWEMNKMRQRIRTVFKELLIYGEIFLRYFRRPEGLAVRSLDPSTIWDIVTNPDDIEDVYYYHQQYVVMNNSPVGQIRGALPPSTLVIRQIPAEDISHYKINSTSSEKRGRSELFAILGWLQRFKEFSNDRVMLNKMRSLFALDVAVEGQQKEVSAAEAQFATPPGTGSVIVHNKSVEIEFKTADASDAANATADGELMLKIIALGAGVSESFLGVGAANTRAGALIQTEPDIKNFEDYQELVSEIVDMQAKRVFMDSRLRAGLKERPKGLLVTTTFPSIAQEDRSSKLKDAGFAESMGWFSKRRAANIAADEFKQNDYDYDEEQGVIKQEASTDPVITSTLQQLPKVGENPSEIKAAEVEAKAENGLTNPAAQMRSDPGNRALPKKNTDIRQGGLNRGAERKRVEFGTKVRASGMEPTRGWNESARQASIAARKAKAQRRLMERNGNAIT